MKKHHHTKMTITVVIIVLAGAAIAFAHGGGYGPGRHMWNDGSHMMGPGYGGPMMGDGPGWGWQRGFGGLTEKEAAAIEMARDKFYNDTKELRGKIDEAAIGLRNEMAKDDPDRGKVADMQNALSVLRAEFDQKVVVHQLEMRKIAPQIDRGRGYGRRGGRGYGGNCWR